MKKILRNILLALNFMLYLTLAATLVTLPGYGWLNLGLFLGNFTLSLFLFKEKKQALYSYLKTDHFKVAAPNLINFVFILGILALINYFSYKHPLIWDITHNQRNSLSEQSKNVVKNINQETNFIVFSAEKDWITIEQLLKMYQYENSSIRYQFINPQLSPDLMSQYQIETIPMMVIKYQDRSERIKEFSEETITQSLFRIHQNKKNNVVFIQGHQELDPDLSDQTGISELSLYLKNNAFNVEKVNLLSNTEINKKDLVLILGPKKDYHLDELKKLRQFLHNGGKLLVAIDPDFNPKNLTNLKAFLNDFGITINNNIIVDKKSHVDGSKGLVPIIQQYLKNNEITKDFKGNTFFPLASAITIQSKDHEAVIQSLIETSNFPDSWAETSSQEIVKSNYTYNKNQDIVGPLTLAVSYEKKGTDQNNPSRMVVLSNATFVSNAYAAHGSNYNLILNMMAWLVGNNNLITFDRPEFRTTPVFLSSIHVATIFYFSVVFCPLLLLSIAFMNYTQRRKT